MKKLTFLSIFSLFLSFTAISQVTIQLTNYSDCDVQVQLYEADPNNNCNLTSNTINIVLQPGDDYPFTNPNGLEFVYAEIVPWPLRGGCFGVALATDQASNCGFGCPGPVGVPTIASAPSNNCCAQTLNFSWTACTGNFGILIN